MKRNLAVIKRVDSTPEEFGEKIFKLKVEADKNETCVTYDINWITDDYVHILEEFETYNRGEVSLTENHIDAVEELKESDMLFLSELEVPFE